MPDTISQTIEQSVEGKVKLPAGSGGGPSIFFMLAKAGELMPMWWSKARDHQLRNFWKTSDHLSGAMSAVSSKLTTIPFKIVAKDMSIKTHVKVAEEMTNELYKYPQYGLGWMDFFSRCIEDLFGTDNGFFAEIVGGGRKDSALTGKPISIVHLDSINCTRTNSPLYPVIYTDSDGTQYKLHYTRVMYGSQMPSSNSLLNGVGFCSVSRCVNAAQNLIDISVYKQEKLGSRPTRQLMITKGGLDPDDLVDAFRVAEETMNMQGLKRYSRTIVVGSRTLQNAAVESIDLSSLPDGFDEEKATLLGMACISMGFGMDIRELFPVFSVGGTKADAIIQHIKQRGKTIGQTILMIENLFNMKYLPPFLEMKFDFQDDSQDRTSAEIRNIRAQARERDLNKAITDVRTEREKMMENGEITRAQFEQLELNDGRLPDGVEVEVLFYSVDPDYKEMLSGVSESNYEQKMTDVMMIISTSKSPDLVRKARYALAAIQEKYEKQAKLAEQMALQQQQSGTNSGTKKPDTTYSSDKYGVKLPNTVTSPPDEISTMQNEGV